MPATLTQPRTPKTDTPQHAPAPRGHPADPAASVNALVAAARNRQLLLARAGRIVESATYADRAARLRRAFARPAAAVALGLSLFLGTGTGAAAQADAPATPVVTATAERELVQEHQRVTGSLQAVSRSAVASQESASVREVLRDEGQAVRAGEVIARLDDTRLQAQLAEAEAAHAAALAEIAAGEAAVEQARIDAQAIERAHRSNAATDRELRSAQTQHRVGQARLEATRRAADQYARQLDLLRIRLDDMTIRAPFDGHVVERHAEPGQWVDAGQPVVTLVSAGTIEARLEVPERFASYLFNPTDELSLAVETAGQTRTSRTVKPVADVDARARTFPVIVELDNARGDWVGGMSVTAWLPAGASAHRITVPKDAVVRSTRDSYLYVAAPDADGRWVAQRHDVEVLFQAGDRAVLAGRALEPGDRVIVEGNERLRPNAVVTIVDPGETQTTTAFAR